MLSIGLCLYPHYSFVWTIIAIPTTCVVAKNSYSHHLNRKEKIDLINLKSTEPWRVWPPNELGKLALGASEAISKTWGRCRGGQGMVHPLCPANW